MIKNALAVALTILATMVAMFWPLLFNGEAWHHLLDWLPAFGDAEQHCAIQANLRSADCVAISSARSSALSAATGVAGLIISVLTLVSVVYGFWQARQTQRTEYRPYLRLSVSEANFTEGGFINLTCLLTNYGRTPASDVSGEVSILANEVSGPGAGQFGPLHIDFTLERAHCGDGERIELKTKERFGNNVTNMVNGGVGVLSISFYIRYKDVFNKAHFEKFKFKFSGRYDASSVVGPLKPSFTPIETD